MEEPKKILIIDPCCPKPYSTNKFQGCGGTEITAAAMAEALSDKGFTVTVEQHNRTTNTNPIPGFSKVWYAVPGENPPADYVIVLRKPETLLEAKERYPDAKLFLWCHDLVDKDSTIRILAACNAVQPKYIIAVSDFHRNQIRNIMQDLPQSGIGTRLRVCYPPIADTLHPNGTEYDPFKLCFISSPHKGLKDALDLFKYIRRRDERFKLHITNPGYYETAPCTQAGVRVHGSVGHDEVLTLLRESLCLFFPNRVFPETFGRVLAEAEAVGTPVITHNMGAAAEVLSDSREFTDCNDPEQVINKVLEWSKGRRPTVRMKKQFRLARVINHWMKEILT